jgi:hypothetical protein
MVTRSLLILVVVTLSCPISLGLAGGDAPASRAGTSRSETNAERAWKAEAVKILSARGDANSLAAAAALSFELFSTKIKGSKLTSGPADLAARASELAPQQAAIAWLRLSLCTESSHCDMREVATVMRWVDAENGAAWLPTLAAAQRDRDTTEVNRILGDMAEGAHFDLYWNSLVVLMFDALQAVRKQLPGGFAASDSARFDAVSVIASSEVVPTFAPLIDACRESAAAAERREWCLKLSKTMQRGDTIASQMVGFSIERRLLAPDSREARAIAERRRILEWRTTAAAKFSSPLLPWTKNSWTRRRVAQMRAMPREEDVCIAILREHKVAIDPPEVRN